MMPGEGSMTGTAPAALDGICVIDLSPMMPGHFCSMILADLGARVIAVERPGTGHFSRTTVRGSFESVNRNKESLTLDLKQPAAQEVLHRLTRDADVVLEGFRPGVVARLAADYDTLRSVRPDLIYCAISGYGQDGPYRDLPGHDPNYLAVAGVLSIAGDPLGPPEGVVGASMADLSGAWFAAIAILAALRARDKYGIGQYIDVALADTSYALMQSRMIEYLVNDRPSKEKLMSRPGIGVFATSDGRFITIGAAENHFWRSLCTVLGLQEWGLADRFATSAGRRQHGNEIREELRAGFLRESSAHWLERLRDAGVPCAPVNDLGEAACDPHAVARQIIEWTDHPDFGTIPAIRFPPIMSATPATTRMRAPMLGEHTDALLSEFGYSEEKIRELHDADAV
jgi:crotonobetainyl-CoA:carnitine CoA-transferase CaiB-like acyl-CoA transferase